MEQLLPFARNSRTHSEEQVAQVAASIREFGWTNPVLVGTDDVIIAGHARVLAARRLGMAEVPVIVLGHLTETQRRALVIADNKLALNAGWHEEMLRLEIESLQEDGFDLNVVGFSDEELRVLLADGVGGRGRVLLRSALSLPPASLFFACSKSSGAKGEGCPMESRASGTASPRIWIPSLDPRSI